MFGSDGNGLGYLISNIGNRKGTNGNALLDSAPAKDLTTPLSTKKKRTVNQLEDEDSDSIEVFTPSSASTRNKKQKNEGLGRCLQSGMSSIKDVMVKMSEFLAGSEKGSFERQMEEQSIALTDQGITIQLAIKEQGDTIKSAIKEQTELLRSLVEVLAKRIQY
ncbi:hypothetical protein HK103_003550, partial [Boothiomyces macroporosus]